MSFRIVHVSPDDKFVPLQQELFEGALPGCNSFRILVREGERLKFGEVREGFKVVGKGYFSSPEARVDFAEHDCVIFHSMDPVFVDSIRWIPDTALVVWSAWGFEYFKLIQRQHGSAVLERTQRFCRSMNWRRRIKKWVTFSGLKNLLGILGRRGRGPSIDHFRLATIAGRLDVVSINPTDLPRIRAALPAMKAVNHLLSYYTTEDTLDKGPPAMTGPDILVGNSATSTNNHLEAFEELRKLDLTDRRIIVPLSYGDMEYASKICKVGFKWFGSSFVPLRDFLTLTEFNSRIAGCGTVVMNHVRQQALGTISAALYKGARLYLRPESPLFEFFEELGVHVYPVSELGRESWRDEGCDRERAVENSRLIGEYWSRERAISQIRLLSDMYDQKRRTVDPATRGAKP